VYNTTPEDLTHVGEEGSVNDALPDSVFFSLFMRLLAAPSPTTSTDSERNGEELFNTVGCALCHTPTLRTVGSPYSGMSGVTYHPFSDFAVHHMGARLADGVVQGAAGPDEFRTAPLWGVGQRLFFLHDGRTSDLLEAIQAHSSRGFDCLVSQGFRLFSVNDIAFQPWSHTLTCGSEADKVIDSFNTLDKAAQQDILNFLRSL
jgi:CxxC motif-containing protein (DUF1111 family)